jgi:hypothetical protein
MWYNVKVKSISDRVLAASERGWLVMTTYEEFTLIISIITLFFIILKYKDDQKK